MKIYVLVAGETMMESITINLDRMDGLDFSCPFKFYHRYLSECYPSLLYLKVFNSEDYFYDKYLVFEIYLDAINN